MEAALTNFANVDAQCKVALLGDMLELGEDSVEEHVKVVTKAHEAGLTKAIFVGEEFAKAIEKMGDKSPCFRTSQELADWLASNPLSDAVILLKGSRGTRMEKVLSVL